MCCQSKTRTPPLLTQLRALSGRALLNVARDPYLAGLHLVLTPVAGVLAGSMFDDLRTLNQETAGIQVCVCVSVCVIVRSNKELHRL